MVVSTTLAFRLKADLSSTCLDDHLILMDAS